MKVPYATELHIPGRTNRADAIRVAADSLRSVLFHTREETGKQAVAKLMEMRREDGELIITYWIDAY